MPDLLLELFSEEIPARMQAQAASDLERLVTGALIERGLKFEGAVSHATPRRLALHIAGLPGRQPDVREERKGPRVGAPEAAVQGFLKSAGLSSLDQAKIEKDPKKGEFYVALIEREGKPTLDLLAHILPTIIRTFPWPKSMRWGTASVRPTKSPETCTSRWGIAVTMTSCPEGMPACSDSQPEARPSSYEEYTTIFTGCAFTSGMAGQPALPWRTSVPSENLG